jgi:hypothetical protein
MSSGIRVATIHTFCNRHAAVRNFSGISFVGVDESPAASVASNHASRPLAGSAEPHYGQFETMR